MVKSLLLAAVLMAMPHILNAQIESPSKIRVRLHLFQKPDDSACKSAAVGLSVFNDSNEDVFIPCFFSKIWEEVHMYKNDSLDNFNEISLWGTDTEHNYQKQKGIVCDDNQLPLFLSNKIYRLFKLSAQKIDQAQDSIFTAFLQSNKTGKYHTTNKDIDQPLFLKSREKLVNIYVVGLDQHFDKSAEYKLVFMLRKCKAAENFPETIFGYKRYIPTNLESNTIYYQIIY